MYYGLLGEHLPHSHSPKIHALLGNCGYALFEKAPADVAEFLQKREFYGINVTIPYKETVMPLLDMLDSVAVEIGAVNTVVNCGGKLYGTNTDCDGFIFMCNRAGIDFKNKNVLVLGSGGTSKTVQYAAKRLGAKAVTVVSRSGDINYENVYEKCADANVIVNTTPLGMYPNVYAKPIELAPFSELTGVVDVIYNPLKTKLIEEAETLNIPSTGGLTMLVAQAAFADRYFRAVHHSGAEIVNAVERVRKELSNVVLIGMPGCGKSTVGKLLASRMNRELTDVDKAVVQRAGKSIPEIFENEGEEAFRNLESEVTREICLTGGRIIACGGGTPLREENRSALKQNGIVFYIKRDLSNLARGGRPLSSGDGAIEKLYAVRAPIYEATADYVIEADENVFSAVDKIREILK